MRAWLKQFARDKDKLGARKAPWYVLHIDPRTGKERAKKVGLKTEASKYKAKLESDHNRGLFGNEQISWEDFKAKLERVHFPTKSSSNVRCLRETLSHFGRLVTVQRVDQIDTTVIDEYKANRSRERGLRKGDRVSPATINKELRYLRALLRKAKAWRHLPELPEFEMVRESFDLKPYVTEEDFSRIYDQCVDAKYPKGSPYPPSMWWQALLMLGYTTGWRVGEMMALRWRDVELTTGIVKLRSETTKGRRSAMIDLHPVVVDHINEIRSFGDVVFPWPHHRELLWAHFRWIQKRAGIDLDCPEDHEHTDACHVYGFHALRRAFATENYEALGSDELQRIMRHVARSTTEGYVNFAKAVTATTADKIKVPKVGKKHA